jgi:hypothetical protein
MMELIRTVTCEPPSRYMANGESTKLRKIGPVVLFGEFFGRVTELYMYWSLTGLVVSVVAIARMEVVLKLRMWILDGRAQECLVKPMKLKAD